ncbi:MAG: hypothetical protein JSR37_08340 [Verrucomicrobia bacterium]|nr:hypothetical protein [Verrucomicrobiota bacterium]MBS0636272.1 hypothetical protein [Verrucomicrobiota bacterium]
MSSINRIGLEPVIPNSGPESLFSRFSQDMKKSIAALPLNERESVVTVALPLIEKSSGYRDDRDLLNFVWRIPLEERAELVGQTSRLLVLGGTPYVSVVLEALRTVKREEREDMVCHVQAFLSGHEIGEYEISDAIYEIKKIAPNKRLALIDSAVTLTCKMRSGVWRCAVLDALHGVPLFDQYDVIQHVQGLINHLGQIDEGGYPQLVWAVSAVSADVRSQVIESSKPLLVGLESYHIANLFLAVAQTDRATIEQLVPLAKLTSVGFYRGQLLLALSELAPEQRGQVIDKAAPLLREPIWWCNAVDNFIRLVAVTPHEELIELHTQVKSFLGTYFGYTVDVLMATARAPRAERVALFEDIKPLLVGNVNLQDLALIMDQAMIMERLERRRVIEDTSQMLCEECSEDRFRLFQTIRTLPSGFLAIIGTSHFCRKNSHVIELLLNCYERTYGERLDVAETLSEALQFWINEAHDLSIKAPEVDFQDNEPIVCEFLAQLKATEEYKNPNTRLPLAKRIIEIFTVMQADEEIKNLAAGIISIGLESCADRVITALDEIELQVRLYKIKKMERLEQEAALKKLSDGFLLLVMIREKIEKLLVKFPELDEIGLHLALQIRLAKVCELPVSTTNMVFARCVGVPVAEIESAVAEILQECSEKRKEQFLSSWQPWMDFQRAHEVVPTYDELEKVAMAPSESLCPISQEPPAQPVIYESTLYDYDHFIDNYRKSGIDPMTRTPIDLKRLKRAVIQP